MCYHCSRCYHQCHNAKTNIGVYTSGLKRVHVNKLPFMASLQAPSADTTGNAEDIEVDLGLQQALIQSIRPSPAKVHTKGNALRDISNWRLPTPAKKQGPAKGRPATPLEVLTGKAGALQCCAMCW